MSKGVALLISIIIFSLCMIPLISAAQSNDTLSKNETIMESLPANYWSNTGCYTVKSKDNELSNFNLSINPTYQSRSITFFGKEIKNPYLTIDSSGNIFYRPSAFSKCDTANDMRFLMNIFNQDKIRP